MKKKYLVACGGHGRVVLDAFLSNQTIVDGIIDGGIPRENSVFGIKVVGDDSFLLNVNASDVILINGFGISKNTKLRKGKYEEWISLGYEILGIIHPTVIVGLECSISASSQIMAGAVLQNRVVLEENVVINTAARIDHDCKIGKHVFVSPGVTICGGVVIETGAFIGAGAIILPGVHIGEQSIVGAGAVVTKNVLSNSTVVGNPARVLKI